MQEHAFDAHVLQILVGVGVGTALESVLDQGHVMVLERCNDLLGAATNLRGDGLIGRCCDANEVLRACPKVFGELDKICVALLNPKDVLGLLQNLVDVLRLHARGIEIRLCLRQPVLVCEVDLSEGFSRRT